MNFLTKEFKKMSLETLEVFNELLKNKLLVKEKDNYASGEFFFLIVIDNVQSRKILSSVISDIDAYIEYHNTKYEKTEKNCIDLSALHDIHKSHFEVDEEIVFDFVNDEYELRG